MVKRKSSGVINMSDIIYVPEYAYSIKEIDFTDPSTFDEQWGWDGISKIKVTQYDSMGNNSFWLESIKNWNYKKNPKWLNERVKKTFKWLIEYYPELMI
jgi:hypothetical protein